MGAVIGHREFYLLLDLGLESSLSLFAPRRKFFALDLPRRTEAEGIDDEGVLVLFLTILVGSVIGTQVRLNDELVSLAGILRDRLT